MFQVWVDKANGGVTPTKAFDNDAAWDLSIKEDIDIRPGEIGTVGTGIYVACPPGYHVAIVGRSSTFSKRLLLVHYGVIDPGYRGELKIAMLNVDFAGIFERISFAQKVRNIENNIIHLKKGERLAQMMLQEHGHTLGAPDFVENLEDLSVPEDGRDQKGWGSSGA